MDIRAALISGLDIPIEECRLILKQPTIEEISRMGEEQFWKGVQCLTLNKSMFVEDKIVLEDINNFQIFMTMMMEKESKDKREAIEDLFLLIFPKYHIIFTPRSLIFQIEGQNIIIDDNNFDFLQNIARLVFCTKEGPMDQQSFNPANQKAKEIADKLMRGRKRVAEQNGSANTSIFAQYLSILSIGLQISILELKKYTMFQLFDSMERYSLYIEWDIDLRVRLAGGKPDDKVDNWMKNIH